REGVGAEDDAPLDLRAESGLAGQRHDLFQRAASVVTRTQPEPDAVEAGQVRGALTRRDQVIRRQGVPEMGARDLHHLGGDLGQGLDRVAERGDDPGLRALARELADEADLHPGQIARRAEPGGAHDVWYRRVDRRGVTRVVTRDHRVEQGRVFNRT